MAPFCTTGILWLLATPLVHSFLSAPCAFKNAKLDVNTRFFSQSAEDVDTSAPSAPGPMLNGKRVLPYKVLAPGLKGHEVAAVYAVLNSNYKRSSEGWEAVTYVGVAKDLDATLQSHATEYGREKVAHVRALSFSFPQADAMQEVASQWRDLAVAAGAELEEWTSADAMKYLFDDDDDDDEFDDDDDWPMEVTAQSMASVPASSPSEEPIVSPFEGGSDVAVTEGEEPLAFTAANVDKVLDEVRPYLIADGGNVSVERVDEAGKIVSLKLEGACGSCASSTVTMQMGIERVLKEKFPDLVEIRQVEDDPESKPTELTLEAVEEEVNRLKPAIIAMGGQVSLVSVDPIGEVVIQYRGANKVQQGLELAILDVPFVKHVKFVMGDSE